jgi:hypothetical protein
MPQVIQLGLTTRKRYKGRRDSAYDWGCKRKERLYESAARELVAKIISEQRTGWEGVTYYRCIFCRGCHVGHLPRKVAKRVTFDPMQPYPQTLIRPTWGSWRRLRAAVENSAYILVGRVRYSRLT